MLVHSGDYCRIFGADDLFPLIVYLLAHVGCDTISRRIQCTSNAIDKCITQVFHHDGEAMSPYYGIAHDEGMLSELRYYCTAMQVAMEYLCMLRTKPDLCDSFLLTSLQHVVFEGDVQVEPACVADASLPDHGNMFTRIRVAHSNTSRSVHAPQLCKQKDAVEVQDVVGDVHFNQHSRRWTLVCNVGPTTNTCDQCAKLNDQNHSSTRVTLSCSEKSVLVAWHEAINTCCF